MSAKIQSGEMEKAVRAVPGSRGRRTPGGSGMTAGALMRLPDFAPGLLARPGKVEILGETRHREYSDFLGTAFFLPR
jgi:hypothetical protein